MLYPAQRKSPWLYLLNRIRVSYIDQGPVSKIILRQIAIVRSSANLTQRATFTICRGILFETGPRTLRKNIFHHILLSL